MAAQGTLSEISGGIKALHCYAAVDLPSIATQVSGTVSVTVTGALPGDLAIVWPVTALTTGLLVESTPAIVATADTVVVRATNASAGTIDAASQVMHIVILRVNIPL